MASDTADRQKATVTNQLGLLIDSITPVNFRHDVSVRDSHLTLSW
jgi:hypothetical protein